MNRLLVPVLIVVSAVTLLAGCAWQVGGGPKSATMKPTTGQQLIDLKHARDAGAITETEYQTQKAKVLGGK